MKKTTSFKRSRHRRIDTKSHVAHIYQQARVRGWGGQWEATIHFAEENTEKKKKRKHKKLMG